ncbi:hypothetical protein G7Y89_g2218 [Cudoniella acicularis]|uniref:Restriction endonuclease type IV Mrr domain-containing protein n=1 Tax=Cudoniella acicularis TaxID=354080 RepID=A0A8H4RTU3_9HELO|nr:hypothetical protein G7Y89_g2218 [Cudoniella acicularis]
MLPIRSPLRLFRLVQQSRKLRKYTTNTTTEELLYPDSQSPNHHDLTSFLEYASRIDMDTTSTTYVGTRYEYTVKNSLERIGMSLKRIGGKSDYGIDILGTWTLPSAPQPLKVLIQCKAFARKVEPSHARELEGAFVGAPTGWRGPGVLGFLVSQKPATKGVREALGRSRWPMGYVLCESDGKMLQMIWNRRAEQGGLEGIGVGLKYGGGDSNQREVYLMWKGEAIQTEASPISSPEV